MLPKEDNIYCRDLNGRLYSIKFKEEYTLMDKFKKTPGVIIEYLTSKTNCFAPTDLQLLIKTFHTVEITESLIKLNNDKYQEYIKRGMEDYYSQLADEQADFNDSIYKEANETFYREFNGDYHDDML